MRRLQRAAVLFQLVKKLDAEGSWCGETHIQKATYFLQHLLKVPLEFRYMLYKHGPFSFELTDEIAAMRADNFLRYVPRPAPYGPSIAPAEGSAFLEKRLPKTCARYGDQVDFVARTFDRKGVAELERIATALYVTLEAMPGGDAGGRCARIRQLKPHISEEEARAAVQEVDKIVEHAPVIDQDGAAST